jgi:hypothetical protein
MTRAGAIPAQALLGKRQVARDVPCKDVGSVVIDLLVGAPNKEPPTVASLLFQRQDDWSRDRIGDAKPAA